MRPVGARRQRVLRAAQSSLRRLRKLACATRYAAPYPSTEQENSSICWLTARFVRFCSEIAVGGATGCCAGDFLP